MHPHPHFYRKLRLELWKQRLKRFALTTAAFVAACLAWYWPVVEAVRMIPFRKLVKVEQRHVRVALRRDLHDGAIPSEIELVTWMGPWRVQPVYTLDNRAQQGVEALLRLYKPDYGALVALDAATGKILSLVSYTRFATTLGNLTLKAWFPAASIFKIVTATAAIDTGRLSPESIITFTGGNHTLYKRNLTEEEPRYGARRMTLREAFAKSVNTVFGKVGAFVLRPMDLEEYAKRFQFNQPLPGDVPAESGRIDIPQTDDDPFALAEIASGFNRNALISPLQGALIAAVVANNGIMMAPYLVENLIDREYGLIYRAEPTQVGVVMSQEAADQLRILMQETVRGGTSRRAFRTFLSRKADEIEVGGKTGSLTGELPKGKCDWFVGYGIRGNSRIAIAALTVNDTDWRVKASQLAREYLERYLAHQ